MATQMAAEDDGNDDNLSDRTESTLASSEGYRKKIYDDLHNLLETRYLEARFKRPRLSQILFSSNDLSDDEYKAQFRMSRESFEAVHAMIQGHPVFQSPPGAKRKQEDSRTQLMVALMRFGSKAGHGSASVGLMAKVAGIGKGKSFRIFPTNLITKLALLSGTTIDYVHRVSLALMSHWSSAVKWPDEAERAAMKGRLEDAEFDVFRHCIGIIDGTLIVFRRAPSLPQAQMLEYKNYRKKEYGLQATVICDDRRLITEFTCHLPGAAHDARAYRFSPCYLEPDTRFSGAQHLLGDSAYPLTHRCITPYKTPRGGALENDKKRFNKHFSGLRIRIEHTIGILKERWASLQGLPHSLTARAEDKKWILLWIGSCVILHNVLMQRSDTWEEETLDEDDAIDGNGDNNQQAAAAADEDNRTGATIRTSMLSEFLRIHGRARNQRRHR